MGIPNIHKLVPEGELLLSLKFKLTNYVQCMVMNILVKYFKVFKKMNLIKTTS